jgi:hypothetical protein
MRTVSPEIPPDYGTPKAPGAVGLMAAADLPNDVIDVLAACTYPTHIPWMPVARASCETARRFCSRPLYALTAKLLAVDSYRGNRWMATGGEPPRWPGGTRVQHRSEHERRVYERGSRYPDARQTVGSGSSTCSRGARPLDFPDQHDALDAHRCRWLCRGWTSSSCRRTG